MEKAHAVGSLTLYIKGAPERVLGRCTTYLKDGELLPITNEFRKEYDAAYDVCHYMPPGVSLSSKSL